MRLSRDDENYGDSVSIETQRTILRQFAKENQLHVMDEYIDDGWSGTNFERPNFKRMMDDVELGKINCIVTKDLSRFGREHVMMDYYLEFVFPEKKVRYIAVSDNEDTEKGLSDFVPFKNLFNEWFAKDTSRKVKTALHAKFAAGQHICTYAPIGYKKHSEVKNLLEIDEETRWIVEKIFDLAYRGAGAAKITNILIDEQIPTAGWLNYTRYGKFAHIYAEAPEEKRYALKGIVRINIISAQRGFSDTDKKELSEVERTSLSSQIRGYYDKYLDPEKTPSPEDLSILVATEQARKVFDQNLETKFEPAIKELEELGYPGVTNPQITISSKVTTTEMLKHDSAIQYSLGAKEEGFMLPEKYNGLGYQNLISIVFDLITFRDGWMRKGKASSADEIIEPLQLVLVEEPEAHLHVQVQQVFIHKAYSILRNHEKLGANNLFSTQLVISTHSSHIAREEKFANLRYFKRLPKGFECKVATSKVVNCTAPIQIEGMFADFLYASSTFQRFTYMDLFERDVLNKKLEKLAECSEVDLEVVEYFEFYFTNLVRNRAAHGRYIKSNDVQDDEILAKELLLDMKCLTHQISRKAEVEKMLRCIKGYLNYCNLFGTSAPDAIYGALYGDFTGCRMHLSYDSLDQYNPIQFLYWIINPYYEKIARTMSVEDEVKKIRGYLYSEDFWRYTYDKMQKDILLGKIFDSDVNSAVKCMFKCPLPSEAKQWLGKIHNILNERKNT